MRQLNSAGLTIIKKYEGILDGDRSTPGFDPYLDPVGIWTIGYGHALRGSGGFLRGEADRSKARAKYPDGLTLSQCEELLAADVARFSADVEKMILVQITDNQFAALVSFAYNCGTNALRNSTLLKLLNAGKPAYLVADQFNLWTHAGGRVLPGLVKRRAAERALFLS